MDVAIPHAMKNAKIVAFHTSNPDSWGMTDLSENAYWPFMNLENNERSRKTRLSKVQRALRLRAVKMRKPKRHLDETSISIRKTPMGKQAEEDLQVTENWQHSPVKSTSNSGRQILELKIFGFGKPSTSKEKRQGPKSKQIKDMGMRLPTRYLEDSDIRQPTTKNSLVESVWNAIDDLNATVVSPGLIQQCNQTRPCSMSSTYTHDRTSLNAQENDLVISKSEILEKSVLESEKNITLEGKLV